MRLGHVVGVGAVAAAKHARMLRHLLAAVMNGDELLISVDADGLLHQLIRYGVKVLIVSDVIIQMNSRLFDVAVHIGLRR